MSFSHFTRQEAEAVRDAWPGHWIVEVDTGNAACLIAVPNTDHTISLPVPFMPAIEPSMLHGATVRTPQCRRTPEATS
jgi:hypothetical protein